MERAAFEVEGPYDLRETLSSGQSFRWRRGRGSFEGFIGGSPARLSQRGATIEVEWGGSADPARAAAAYLRVEDPLEELYGAWAEDQRLSESARRWRGLHLLAQEPFETTISFIASSASNIPKITRSVEKMCAKFGKSAGSKGASRRAFPTPQALAAASPADLRACELGYRARYVKSAARAVAEGEVDLGAVARMPTAEAQAALVEGLDGVGPKVAACALLFSMGKDDAFPVDRWVQRRVSEWYLRGRKMAPKRVEEWGRRKFGKSAGYAQQYLFHDARKSAMAARVRSRR